MKNLNPIHQNPQERQESATEKLAQSIDVTRETIERVAEDKAKSSDIQEVVEAIKSIPESNPFPVVDKLEEVRGENVSANEKLANLEKQNSESQDLMKTLIREVKSRALPVELVGMEQIIIQGENGADGHTPTTEELTAIIEPLIPEPIHGKDGRNPMHIGSTPPTNPLIGDLWTKI